MSISAIPSSTFSPYPLSAASNLYQQDFKQLGQDLKSGNLAAAQKDFSTIQQDLQSLGGPSIPHSHHRYRVGIGDGNLINSSSLLQDLNQVGQALASGNLSAAQQAYAALQAQPPVSTGGILHHPEPPVSDPAVSLVA
jgi:hypothetical protein